MSKKILAVILAVVMALGCFSLIAVADDEVASAADTVSAWKGNLAPVLAELRRNESSAHWKYVAENDETLSKTMLTYTAFALYDDAWKNGFDKSVSVENAEKILVSLVEKIDANVGESKVAEIVKVLQTAKDLNDLLQKVNSYVKISDTLTSSEWNTAFKYIEYAIKIGKLYEEARDEVIEAYARILSVQAANEMYKDFLTFVAQNTGYDVVVTACNELIHDIDTSVEELIKDEVLKASGFTASNVLNTAARIALDTNAYTAVALKVYDIGVSAADVLWNTSDQYALMDQLYTTFFVETPANAYVDVAEAAGDADLFRFAVSALAALRQAGAESLYNLKLAQNQGLVGMVKNQINYNITITEANELAFLSLASKALFDTDINDYVPVDSVIQVDTTAIVKVGDTKLFAATNEPVINADGFFEVVLNEAAGLFVKTAFVPAGKAVKVYNDEDALCTLTVNVIDGYLKDYSFTSLTVGPNASVEFDTAFDGGYVYSYGAEEFSFSSEFVYPAYNEVTASSVATAVVNVVRDQTSAKIASVEELIRSFFDGIINAIRTLFKNIKLGK